MNPPLFCLRELHLLNVLLFQSLRGCRRKMRAAAVKVLTKDRSDVSSVHREEEEMITHTHTSLLKLIDCVFSSMFFFTPRRKEQLT